MFDWQTIGTAIIVLAAAAFIGARAWMRLRSFSSNRSFECSDLSLESGDSTLECGDSSPHWPTVLTSHCTMCDHCDKSQKIKAAIPTRRDRTPESK